jgi:hypothetical protein
MSPGDKRVIYDSIVKEWVDRNGYFIRPEDL